MAPSAGLVKSAANRAPEKFGMLLGIRRLMLANAACLVYLRALRDLRPLGTVGAGGFCGVL